jgi:hypothetical protein
MDALIAYLQGLGIANEPAPPAGKATDSGAVAGATP